MKRLVIVGFVLACLSPSMADESFCTLPLRPGETAGLPAKKLKVCNRLTQHLCRHFCKAGVAAELCRICQDTLPGRVGPCGLRIGTIADCCAAGIPVETLDTATGQRTCACPAAPCIMSPSGAFPLN